MSRTLLIGTRGSALARAQAGRVAAGFQASGLPTRLITITTQGDVDPTALTRIGGTGVFVTAVRAALLAGQVDVAVHSFKDLPTAAAAGVALGAVPERGDPADALCARDALTLATLPPGSRVGTGSPRRAAFLRAHRPDLQVQDVRGNVDTRLRLVVDGQMDAVVLAAAGLERLGRSDAITDRLGDELMPPAAAQGALALECRLADRQSGWFAAALARLDHPASRAEVLAERNLLATLEAGCSAPVGTRARTAGDRLRLTGTVISTDGRRRVSGTIEGTPADAAKLGRRLAIRLLADGAAELLKA